MATIEISGSDFAKRFVRRSPDTGLLEQSDSRDGPWVDVSAPTNTKMATADCITAFSKRVAEAFEAGLIRAPVHLDGGNEQQLVDVFARHFRPGDWVCGSWRMQAKCLLAGVPEEELWDAVLAGQSISLCFPKHRVISSAIVGGILPIALGIAAGEKRRGSGRRVLCFLGDMTAETGTFHECLKYSRNFDLPVTWVVEDNGKSVNTPTREAWGGDLDSEGQDWKVVRFQYTPTYPHHGTGKWVNF